MKAFLHIGIEKTGSTSIQEFLKTNPGALAETDTAYYFGPELRNSRELAVYCMNADMKDDFTSWAFAGSGLTRKQWREGFLDRFEKDMKKMTGSSRQIIFSSEHFHSRLTTHEEVERLKSLLSPWFDEIEIIVYLRRQDKVAVSLFSTLCRNGGTREAIFKPRISSDDQYHNYLGLLERWTHVFENTKMHIRIFERSEFYGSQLYSDFLHTIGLSKTGSFSEPPLLNEKLSASVQSALIIVNQHLSGEEYAPIRKEFLEKVADLYPGAERLPTRQEAEAYYALFQEDNSTAARKFLNKDDLFNDDFSAYPEEGSELSLPEPLVRELVSTIANTLKPGQPGDKPIKLQQDRGGILRDLASRYMDEQPQIALVLLEEALRYRPKGPKILSMIQELGGSATPR
jgi:hypothetical protein